MGSIAVSESVSLDGVTQSPGANDVRFKYSGWPVDHDAEGDRFDYERDIGLEHARTAHALLLGRVTHAPAA